MELQISVKRILRNLNKDVFHNRKNHNTFKAKREKGNANVSLQFKNSERKIQCSLRAFR